LTLIVSCDPSRGYLVQILRSRIPLYRADFDTIGIESICKSALIVAKADEEGVVLAFIYVVLYQVAEFGV
jgi:hypothetical protein